MPLTIQQISVACSLWLPATRELEQNSALQLNELTKFHEKPRDLKFAEPGPQQLEKNSGTSF